MKVGYHNTEVEVERYLIFRKFSLILHSVFRRFSLTLHSVFRNI